MADAVNDARFWDRAARKYATDPIRDMAGYERTLDRARAYLTGNEAAYEFGCGTGTTALRLAPFVGRIVGTDISPEMIAIARERAQADGCANAAFDVGTPDTAPWPDGTFDVAFGFNVLHLVARREAALQGVHRLLRPGGTVHLEDAVPQGDERAGAPRRAGHAGDRQGALRGVPVGRRHRADGVGGGARHRGARPPRLTRPGCAAVPRGAQALIP